MKSRLTITVAISIFILSSCGKLDDHTYSGRILAYGTLEPVEGAVVQIIAGKSVGFLEPAVVWIADSVRTDKNGKFKITINEGDYHEVGKIIKDGYFTDLVPVTIDGVFYGQDPSLFDSGPLTNKDYFLDPKGTLHVVVENDPNVVGDFILIRAPQKPVQTGTFTGLIDIYQVRANRFQGYSLKIDDNPTIFDSIFCIPFDTTFLKIVF